MRCEYRRPSCGLQSEQALSLGALSACSFDLGEGQRRELQNRRSPGERRAQAGPGKAHTPPMHWILEPGLGQQSAAVVHFSPTSAQVLVGGGTHLKVPSP